MPDDGTLPNMPGGYAARHDRALLMAFVTDSSDEAALREGLAESMPEPFEIRRGGVRAAIAAMEKMPTPRSLIVDVSGEDEPLRSLGALSEVVEPDVQVLVTGDVRDADFYREVTRGMGAVEYLAKPLTRDRIGRHFGPVVLGRTPVKEGLQGGRIITVTGVRGGVGATTIACNLAWHFGTVNRRHTMLLDPNLQLGTAALMLNAAASPGLRTALETPDRVDDLFVQRAAHAIGDRLHILAAQESVQDTPVCAPGAMRHMLDILARHYSLIVADTPFAPVPMYHELLDAAHQRVLVMEPSLAAVRDAARLLSLPHENRNASRTVIVLNRDGLRGGMTRKQVEDALEMKADLVLPDLPRQVQTAASLGEPAAAGRGFFKLRIAELAQQLSSSHSGDGEAASRPASRAGLSRRPWARFMGGRA